MNACMSTFLLKGKERDGKSVGSEKLPADHQGVLLSGIRW